MGMPSPDLKALGYAVQAERRPGPFGELLLSPAGLPSATVGVLAAASTAYAASGPGIYFVHACLAVLLGSAVAVVWVMRITLAFTAAMYYGRPSALPWRRLPRWTVVPAIAVVTAAFVWADVPAAVAFHISRPAMERAARAALARSNNLPARAYLGAYGTCDINVDGTTAIIQVPGGFLETYGFAYCPSGRPATPYAQSWSLGGSWYGWDQKH